MMERELPKGWMSTNLETLYNLKYGKGLPVKDLTEEGYPVYGANGVIGKYKSFMYEEPKVIISCRGAASGAIHKTTSKSYITSNSIILDEVSKSLINIDFVKYAMIAADKEEVITGTAQPQITIQLLKNLSVNLPPLPEQKRIVAKLDALFGHLDTLREKLDRIPELLKNFRQQVLTEAVTGRLTEEWRGTEKLIRWNSTNVGAFMTEVKEKVDPSEIKETNYIGLEHIEKDGKLIGKSTSSNVKSSKTKFLKGDVLYGKLRPYLNKHVLATFNGVCSTDILVYRNQKPENCFFFNLYLGTPEFIQKANTESKGINLPRVSAKTINQFAIDTPPSKELAIIQEKVLSLFSAADKIEAQYQNLKSKIDSLPQAILAKAFKGELVAQNANDEPAGVLLERIKREKESFSKVSNFGKDKKRKVGKTTYNAHKNSEGLEGRMVAEGKENYEK
jgi:type I restriction enzyme S subunit